MAEGLRRFYFDVIEGKMGILGSVVRLFLKFLSLFYWIAIGLREVFYHFGFFRVGEAGVPIFSVGNITCGGTGKTPMVICLARDLLNIGRNPAVLMRGYGRSSRGMQILSDGKRVYLTPREGGDEAYMIAESLPDIPVILCKNRLVSGDFAQRKFGVDSIILDDGFQYRGFKDKFEIVLIDATNPFSNGVLIPGGFLRETKGSLKRADIIVLTRCNQVEDAVVKGIKSDIEDINPNCPILLSMHENESMIRLTDGKKFPIDRFSRRDIVALSSIANPFSFYKSLTNQGFNIKKTITQSDHYFYSKKDISDLDRSLPVITTQKDAVKLSGFDKSLLENIYYIKIVFKIIQGQEIWQERIRQALS